MLVFPSERVSTHHSHLFSVLGGLVSSSGDKACLCVSSPPSFSHAAVTACEHSAPKSHTHQRENLDVASVCRCQSHLTKRTGQRRSMLTRLSQPEAPGDLSCLTHFMTFWLGRWQLHWFSSAFLEWCCTSSTGWNEPHPEGRTQETPLISLHSVERLHRSEHSVSLEMMAALLPCLLVMFVCHCWG